MDKIKAIFVAACVFFLGVPQHAAQAAAIAAMIPTANKPANNGN